MLKSQIIALIKLRLGSRTDSDLDALIEAEMDLTQMQLEHDSTLGDPWFLETQSTARSTSTGVATLALPTGYLGELEEGGIWIIESSGTTPLKRNRAEKLRDYFSGYENTQPTAYAIAKVINFFPTPDAAYSLLEIYKGSDIVPSAMAVGDTNNWMTEAPDLMIASVGMQVAKYVKDLEAYQAFAADEAVARARVKKAITARENEGRDWIMGDD